MIDYRVYFEATLDADESHYAEDFVKKMFQEKGWKAYNFLITQHEVTEELTFEQELTDLLNRHNIDGKTGTADWILATHVITTLNAVEDLNKARKGWGRIPFGYEEPYAVFED